MTDKPSKGITQSPSGWTVSKKKSPYPRLRVTVPTLEEAENILALYLKGQLDMDTLSAVSTNKASAESLHGPTWGELLKLTIRARWSDKKSTAQEDQAKRVIKQYLGEDTPAKELSSMDALEIAEKMEEDGKSNSTISGYMSSIRTMLNTGVDMGVIRWNLPKLPHKKATGSRIRFFSYEEEITIISIMRQVGSQDYAELFQFLIETGCRTKEGMYLKWQDVDLEHKLVRIWATDTKTSESRRVALTDVALEVLKDRRKADPFAQRVFGDCSKGGLRRVWDKVRLATGIDDADFIPYVTRHTCATRLIQAGVDVVTIKEMLGHKRIETTMKYIQFHPGMLLNATEALNAKRNARNEVKTL